MGEALKRFQGRLITHVTMPMATSQVEERIRALMQTRRKRSRMTGRSVAVMALAAAALLLPLAMLRPGRGAQMPPDPSPPPPKFAVVVDAGHGGKDTGAVGLDGTFEKDIDLAIAEKLRDTLTKQGVRVIMTRTDDTYSSLTARPAFVRANGAQYLVSIHCDSEGDANSHSGITAFYHGTSLTGKILASDVIHHVDRDVVSPTRSLLSDKTRFVTGFAVLRNSPVPSVLVECGYMNNAHDLAALHQEGTQQQIADGVAAGLEDFAAQQARSQANAAVSAVHAVPGEADARHLLAQGGRLTSAQAHALERRLNTDPNNLTLHIELLGHYGQPEFRFRSGKTNCESQILWLIRTHPTNVLCSSPDTMMYPKEDGAAYTEARRLWLNYAAVPSASAQVLENRAFFLTLHDFPDAERLYLRLETSDPKNPEWLDRLGHLYQLQEADRHGLTPDYRGWARKALAQYQRLPAADPQTSYNVDILADTARAAYDAGKYDTAKACAQRLLALPDLDRQSVGVKFFGEGSTAVQQGNMILGRLALRDGDVPQAKARLLAMGDVSGSPVLNSFGPNMQLAQDLLQHGERPIVLQYFDECRLFWKNGNGLLAQWREAVEGGRMPNFGGNLF